MLFFNIVATISYAFSAVMNKEFYATHKKKKKSAQLPIAQLVFHVAVATAETQHPPPHCSRITVWSP